MITNATKTAFKRALTVGTDIRLMNCRNPVWRINEDNEKFSIPVGDWRNAKVAAIHVDEIAFDDGYGISYMPLPWRTLDRVEKKKPIFKDMRLEQAGNIFIIGDDKQDWAKIEIVSH